MARITVATNIQAPLQKVWDFTNDMQRMPEWVTFADELISVSDGPVGLGTVYRERGGVGPIKSVSEWSITEFEPPHRQVHIGDLGIMKPVLTMTLEPTSGGVIFRQDMEFQAMPFFRPLGILLEWLFIRRSLEKGLHETQANLKRLLEADTTGESHEPTP